MDLLSDLIQLDFFPHSLSILELLFSPIPWLRPQHRLADSPQVTGWMGSALSWVAQEAVPEGRDCWRLKHQTEPPGTGEKFRREVQMQLDTFFC